MKIFIVEDEAVARRRLKNILKEVKPDAVIAGEADSIEGAVTWLKENPVPDLALMDIELVDGQSFEIFEQTTVQCPVIFITAYDGFAIKAFKHNSIDYLLKPIVEEELEQSLQKLNTMKELFAKPEEQKMNVAALMNELKKQALGTVYRTRFLIRIKDRYHTIEISNVSWFYATQKVVMAHCYDKKEYAMDHSLDELEKMVNPADFFRANRQFIVSKKAIHTILSASYGKLTITLDKENKQQVIISRERAAEFKEWLSW